VVLVFYEIKNGCDSSLNIRIEAPAKINLFLHMKGRREDGYHLLSTMMQKISLYDTIELSLEEDASLSENQIHYSCNKSYLGKMEKNTAVKAALAFLALMPNRHFSLSIHLIKNIPSQAGLGGGSADAAYVLRALDSVFPGVASRKHCYPLPIGIGADVPFFLYEEAAICEGIGEIIRPVAPVSGLAVLLLKPKGGVSTPQCFAKYDEISANMSQSLVWTDNEKKLLDDFLFPKDESISAKERLLRARPILQNDLYVPSLTFVRPMQYAKRFMERENPITMGMSGSGSCMFGIFENEEAINRLLASKEMDDFRSHKWFVSSVMTR